MNREVIIGNMNFKEMVWGMCSNTGLVVPKECCDLFCKNDGHSFTPVPKEMINEVKRKWESILKK